MRHMLLLSTGALFAACAAGPAPGAVWPERHPLLEGLSDPVVNLPPQAPPRSDRAGPPARPDPTPGSAILWRAGAAFAGDLTATGNIAARDKLIVVTPPGTAPIEIAFVLPQQMSAMRPYAGTGEARLHDLSGPQGADRLVVVRGGSALLLGEVWLTGAGPLRIDLGGGLTLEQTAVTAAQGQAYAQAALTLFDQGRALAPLQLGQPTRIATSSGQIEVFVEVSHLQAPDRGATGSQYIVRAWLAGVG